jgi:predicted O-methyltransferase YrrM
VTSFHDAWNRARGIEGWLTEGQARRLFLAALRVPPAGQVVEIGSFRGRSASVLATAAPRVVCIDPHLGSDRGPQELAADLQLGASDFEAFHANLAGAGVAGRITHVRELSGEALAAVAGPVDLLFVDGAHRYGPALDDLRRWGARVPPGGRMLVHDSFSSVGVTSALLRSVVFSESWRYLGRERSLAEWERRAVPAGAAERGRSAATQLASLGWFVRNVVVKALILGGRPRYARLLGHREGPWPY